MILTALPAKLQKELPGIIEKYNINTSLRLTHFLAQCAAESGNFTILRENLNYSVVGLLNTFKKYFKTTAEASLYARQPERIANRVYANRMGNGNEQSGDGWKHRGRGYSQLTGKNNYTLFDKTVDDDILANPDLVATKYPLESAGWFWNENNLNTIADTNNIEAVTRVVNGGLTHLDKRIEYLARYKKLL